MYTRIGIWDDEENFLLEVDDLGEKTITRKVLDEAFYDGRNSNKAAARELVMKACLDFIDQLIARNTLTLTSREYALLVWSIVGENRGWTGDGWDFLQGMQEILIEKDLLPKRSTK